MDDMSEKISALLNNPEMLEKIKGLSGLLGETPNKPASDCNEKKQSETEHHNEKSDALPADMMQMFIKMAPIISSMNKDDENTKFLHALKPLLSKKRQKKIDEALKILQMMRLLPLIKSKELF